MDDISPRISKLIYHSSVLRSFKVIYLEGRKNCYAGALSRLVPNASKKGRGRHRHHHGQWTDQCCACSSQQLRWNQSWDGQRPVFVKIMEYVMQGQPDSLSKVSKEVQPYWIPHMEIAVKDGILLKMNRIIYPPWLRPSTLSKNHEGHLGIEESCLKARDAVFWPWMKQEMIQLVECCELCQSNAQSQKQPSIQQPEMPPHAWHTLASDLFYLNKQNYFIILMVFYFSKYPAVRRMPNITSAALVYVMCEIFADWGPSHIIKANNGTCYIYKEFLEFLASHKDKFITSSPHHPQSSGLAEAYLKHAKNLLIKDLEAGKLWFHVLHEYPNSPKPTFTSKSNGMPEGVDQPSSIASSQWQVIEYCKTLSASYITKEIQSKHPGDSGWC